MTDYMSYTDAVVRKIWLEENQPAIDGKWSIIPVAGRADLFTVQYVPKGD